MFKDKLPDDKIERFFLKTINNEYINKGEYYKFENYNFDKVSVLLNIIELDKGRNE